VVAYDHTRKAENPVFGEAVAMLRAWDGQMDQEHPEPLITTLVGQHLRKAIAERASPGNGPIYDVSVSYLVTERILRERPPGWFGDYNELVLRCFADAMEEGQRLQGSDPKRWKWGKYMYLVVTSPVGSRIPLVGHYFNIGPAPMSGSSTTVKQTTLRLGPSERMNASPGDWDASLLNLPIGESGHFASRHYNDEWNAYYGGNSFPMQFNKVDVRETVRFLPRR
jgi:penicillin G amidase